MRPAILPKARPIDRHFRIGPYRICLEIAAGGMATVYLARSPARVGQDRFVALKVAHPHLARDRVFVEMFEDEARIASLIHHPNVCRVLDFDAAEGEPYLAMEYLHGENLATVFGRHAERLAASASEPVDLGRHAALVARAMADACAGLHAAHELVDDDGTPLEVVHRDVSPENVFLGYDGVVKIVDFGVARAARSHHRTSTGFVKGKLAYLQPEAIESKPMDRRADVWGVGVTMWELLTGERLFRRDGDLDTLRAIADMPIAAPSEARPGLPDVYDAAVMRALARDPRARFDTARDMARELHAILAASPPAPDTVDLGEWMAELFPGGRERSRFWIECGERIANESCEGDAPAAEAEEGAPTTRRRLFRAPPPPLPSSWPPPPRRRAERTRATAFAVWLGACAFAVGALVGTRTDVLAAMAGAPRADAAARASKPAPAFAPSAAFLTEPGGTRALVEAEPRTWGAGEAPPGPAPERRTYSFEIGEDTDAIVLEFRKARPSASLEARARDPEPPR